MSLSLRTTILATGCILALGTSAARAQMPLVSYYYPAPGNYATTQGTVNIPAAGYYYNVPLYTVPAPVNPALAQGSTYSSYSSFYYPRGGASTEGGGAKDYELGDERPSSAYVSGDNEDNPDW
jgi:hypothetical protein